MAIALASYEDRYSRWARLERRSGILLIQLHTNGAECIWGGHIHEELPLLFQDVGNDRDNEAVILTGTGGAFIGGVEPSTWPDAPSMEPTKMRRQIKHIFLALLNIDVPVIGAINGECRLHAMFPLLSDIVLASSDSVIQEAVHFENGVVPGDGAHIVFPMLLGPNRGRYFLLMNQELTAQEAMSLGVVNEVLSSDRLLSRAWEIAERMVARPRITRVFTKLALAKPLKRAFMEDMDEGYALEMIGLLTSGRIKGYEHMGA
jgi:enoyl-CoA hydratase/carnithine racemase